MECTDQEIIAAVLNGDKDAFGELMDRYKRAIYSVVYHMTSDPHEANDLFQEAFIRIYQSLGRFQSRSKFSTWAVRIAANLCIDRRRRRKDATAVEEQFSEIPDARDNPEEDYINREQVFRLRKAVNGLPEKYRTAIILYHQEGLAYEEIAEILRWPMSMVKNRLYRGRMMLREMLAADEGGDLP